MTKPSPFAPYQDDPTVQFLLTLLAVRHGKKQGKPVHNDDALLTDLGIAQVTATGLLLANRYDGAKPGFGFASNLPRTPQTATILMREMGVTEPEELVVSRAGFGYQWLADNCGQHDFEAIDRLSGAPHGSITAAQMAEEMPTASLMAHGMLTGALATVLSDWSEVDMETGFDHLPDGSSIAILANHSPIIEFLPHREDWATVTKRGEASGIIIPVVGWKNGRIEVVRGAECFDAGSLES